ncbi:kinase-like domain-containing protein [Mycena sp. CBHHK59/15]|nr:kinase-like domain-containing protein [Mycena sp. CBHHK59/15]
MLLLVLPCAFFLAGYILFAHYRIPRFRWKDRHSHLRVWEAYGPLLSRRGLILYDTTEFDEAPPPPRSPALDPFDPRDDEDFISRIYRREGDIFFTHHRTRPGDWGSLTPFVHLALDSRFREVMIKAVPSGSQEERIIRHLSSTSLRRFSENHTIPVMSIFRSHDATFVVQAYWGTLEKTHSSEVPSMSFWAAIKLYQLLEGLVFMHQHGIAHGDIYPGNLTQNFQNARSPAPCAFFHAWKNNPSYRIAYIDFEFAIRISDDTPRETFRCAVTGNGPPLGYRAPELDNKSSMYDPFAADVYSLGYLFLTHQPPATIPGCYQALIEDMMKVIPAARPDARTAFERLKRLNEDEKHRWV